MVDAIEDNAAAEKTVNLKQTVGDWQTADAAQTLKDICGGDYVKGVPSNKGTATITWVAGAPAAPADAEAGTEATEAIDGHCTISFGS